MRNRHARALLPAALLFSLAVLSLSGCGGNIPATSTLLSEAQQKFNDTTSLHFVMTADHLGTVPANSYIIVSAIGDMARPNRLRATATVNAGFLTTQIQLIIVGSQQWYTDPLTGQFVATTQFGSYLRIFDPSIGLGALLRGLKNPSTPKDGSANGTPCWAVSGGISMAQLTAIFGSAVVGSPNQTTFCISKSDDQLLSVVLQGRVLSGDTSETVRTIDLTDFDRPVSIQTPTV